MKLSFNKVIFVTLLVLSTSGCSTKSEVNPTAQKVQPHYIDTEIENLSKLLIDEQRALANIRAAKQQRAESKFADKANTPNGAVFVGLETKRTFQCYGCDIKLIMDSVATLLGWEISNVYELGRKPAQGVNASVKIENQPLMRVLEQVEKDTGHIADIRLDPNFKSILIEYKNLIPSRMVE